jgi:kynureninase
MLNRQDCIDLDAADPLRGHQKDFVLPDDVIYFDGNSLGALPHCVVERLGRTVTSQWGKDLIGGWNKHWIGMPVSVGEKIAPIIGAAPGQVVCADSTSVNLFKLLAAALQLNPTRRTIVSQADNFPTDIYMAQGLARLVGEQNCRLKQVDETLLLQSIDDDTCVVMLTEVNFRNGRRHDVAAITRAAHARGALVLWDLAHSAGAMPVHLDDWDVDLAVGCGYKFLNGGPGAPAFLYVAKRHQERAIQPLAGWMGHAAPFDFEADYVPGLGVMRFLCGTPSVLGLSALDAALDMWRDIDLNAVRLKSQRLSRLFIELVSGADALQSLVLISPTDDNARGSQVCYQHSDGYGMVQALIAQGVVADFRAPDILRFGFSPLYNGYVDVWDAVARLAGLVASGTHLHDEFQSKSLVT